AAVGDHVRVEPFRATGRLVSLDAGRGEAEVEVGGKRMRVAAKDVRRVATPAAAASSSPRRPTSASAPAAAPGSEPSASATAEIVLVGLRVDAAKEELESAIDDALLAGKGALRVVHGHGTGRLGAAVKEFLSEHPGVASHR